MSLAPATVAAAARIVAARTADPAPVLGPHEAPCVCARPWWEHAGTGHAGKGLPSQRTDKSCKRYRVDPAHRLADEAMDADGRSLLADVREHQRRLRAADRAKRPPRGPGQWGISLSDVGGCRKAIQFREEPPEGLVRDPEYRGEATLGGLLHEGVQEARKALYPWRIYETRESLEPYGLDATTRHDEYDPISRVYTEMKSAGRATWDYQRDNGPRWGHAHQAHTNARVLIDRGHPVETVVVHYLHRENGREEQHVEPYDPEIAQESLTWLTEVATGLDLGLDMPRDGDGPTNDPICGRCPFRSACWNIPRAVELGRSPESLTVLGEDVDAAAVEVLLAEHVDAATTYREADRRKKMIATLLVGVPHGKYGPYTLGDRSNGEYDDMAAYRAQVEAHWHDDPSVRPDMPPVPPRVPKARSLVVRPPSAKERKALEAQTPAPVTPAPPVDPDPAGVDDDALVADVAAQIAAAHPGSAA